MMIILAILLPTSAAFLLTISITEIMQERLKNLRTKQEKKLLLRLKDLFSDKNPQQILKLYFIMPAALGIAGLLFFGNFLFLIIGAVLGLFIPNFLLKMREGNRKRRFNNQILDAIMILSSSLKGGLSLLQALEVLMEEMPAPMSQEIGLVVRENKMGVTLEDSLRHLLQRMNIEELGLVVNSILVARETGGDLTKVFSRLSTTIRDNKKLKDSIKTLTMQGRMQGIIMSALPFLFVWWVISFNRNHFDIMFNSEIGRTIMFIAVVLQLLGMFFIRKFSTINI